MKAALTCSGCQRGISTQSKTGRCRSCVARHINSDPEIRARAAAGRAAFAAKPGVREQRIANLAAHRLSMSEEEKARRRARGRFVYETVLNTPENRARANDPEVRRLSGRKRTETLLGWCPPHLRAMYRTLTITKRLPAAEAREIVLKEAAREERARRAALSPLERQFEQLAKGAQLVCNVMPRKADHAFTLGGVGSGLL